MATTVNRPHLEEEKALWSQGIPYVFGIDEAGRGCLAGPVTVGALMLPMNSDPAEVLPEGVRDSKQVGEEERETLFDQIIEKQLLFGVGWATAKEVDRWNVLRATYLATTRAVEQALAKLQAASGAWKAEDVAFLTDGSHPLLSSGRGFLREPDYAHEFPQLKKLFHGQINEKCIIKGDAKILSIAAASVCAKVSRDRYMRRVDGEFPNYAFKVHKGYGTAKHLENLRKSGPCSEHRFSYTPVAEASRLWNK